MLIGVATPSDLISDPQRTPFNIGQRLELSDFTYEEALRLTDGLDLTEKDAEQVLQWVLKWTKGHPYLTQRLCRAIAGQHRMSWTESEVDGIVGMTFLGNNSEHDTNLRFVSDTQRAGDLSRNLSRYTAST